MKDTQNDAEIRGIAAQPQAGGYTVSRRISRAHNIADLQRAALRRLPRAIADFIDGGAEDEVTLQRNRQAWAEPRFAPHILTDVTEVDLTTRILDSEWAQPFMIGPTGAAGFLWPDGDLALARAAASAGVPFALSTSANISIEALRASVDGSLWFQCYIFKQRDFSDALIARALAAGYDALVITVDFPVGGNRERDHKNDFTMPFRFTPRIVWDFVIHPRWSLSILRHGTPQLANLQGFAASNDTATVASSVGRNYDAAFNWDDLARIRDRWPRKLIVKGVVRPDDAERLIDLGVDAIVVSNHGGRQLDAGIATLDALPGVVAAARGRVPVLIDGGIRRGSDIVKAIALGASGVLLGRATLFGLAAGGSVGVARALDILRSEVKRTMQFCGVTRVADIGPDILAPARGIDNGD
ncbi:alpha-hydroxy acid oxidase [Puniceibacterium sp. IMCC21224]|uniref:alpha-hydroxy acid oxidase n=1 Tax=Puniceibacterium sp. IMCC21224 TaxID=1618204 RepID=UPI00065D9D8A|nr:alpha-hydroxy acid oxidase [Puniceibacterium sp. IMCC21224]KMK65912.1 alpha-hydroxyacid dehydrogenase, FMN-dependent L-lactate dehydrogenase [Puniceibacterium sp. IMCC21224]